MIKLAICEDNEVLLNQIGDVIEKKYADELSVYRFTTAFSISTFVMEEMKGDVGILLMDIKIGDDNGIDVAKQIQEWYPHIKVIFLTGYIDFSRDIFQAEPIYFLVKPLEAVRLYEAIDKAIDLIHKEMSDSITLRYRGEVINIITNNIIYIESDKRLLHIHENGRTVTTVMKMEELMKQLPAKYVRCHQSYAINMDKIRNISMTGVEVCTGEELPVSRGRYKEAREQFLKYMGYKL